MAKQLSAQAHNEAMHEYVRLGTDRAYSIGNRGPIRFDADGKLAQEILDAYWQHGFYIFEGLIAEEEISLLRQDYDEILDHAPVDNNSDVDVYGRPAWGIDFARRPYSMITPLSDPWGGTDLLGGRHQTQMDQPRPPAFS